MLKIVVRVGKSVLSGSYRTWIDRRNVTRSGRSSSLMNFPCLDQQGLSEINSLR